MAFNYKDSLDSSMPMLRAVSLLTGKTFTVGDVVETYTNGRATNGAAAAPVYGIIHAIVKGNPPLLPPKSADVTLGTATDIAPTSVTTTANDVYYALIDVNKKSIYSAEVNGTLGTTNSSNLIGCQIDVDSANTDYGRVLETTATRTINTVANLYSHGLDPEDSTRLLVSIAASELDSVNVVDTDT